MKDPYEVLHISSTASDEEVKKAYRELARKYHPDNYHDNPLADLAQEKMKEINEAYATINRMREGRSGGAAASSGYDRGYSSHSSDPMLQQARAAVARGNIAYAERLLDEARERSAEWYFLKGGICFRRGWMDEALRYIQTACQMEPGNQEYRQALEMLQGSGYRPSKYDVYSTNCGGLEMCCAQLACMSGGCYICPCFCI